MKLTARERALMGAVLADARKLASGHRAPSLKLALWIAALSTMQKLYKNIALAELLRQWVDSSLPNDPEKVWKELKKAGAVVFGDHVEALYAIEYLDRTGKLDHLKHFPRGYVLQDAWRDRAIEIPGISYKTASFAALIYSPLTCELVPVDRHVMERLGYGANQSSPSRKKPYIRVEMQVWEERERAGCGRLPLALWHWFRWEDFRQGKGVSQHALCESHERLTCRDY